QHPGPQGGRFGLHVIGSESLPALGRAGKLHCFSSFSLWHSGHSTFSSPKTSVSNSCSQSWQVYSYIGMAVSPYLSDSCSPALVYFAGSHQDLSLVLRQACLAESRDFLQH